MSTTLIIRTADTSRDNWKYIHSALRGQGLELHRYHAAILDGGMTIVADARHQDGGEHLRARKALAALPASLAVLH